MSKKVLAALMLIGAVGTPVAAAEYPTKPVQVIVPYNAGGAVDFVARVVAQNLSERLGQQVVVENRPGASGNIGTQSVAQASPDGHMLLMSAVTSTAITLAMQKSDAGFDLKADFAPVATVGLVPTVLVVNSSIPADTVEAFVQYIKDQEKPVSFASSGIGSTEHLGGELFQMTAGVKMLHVPYTGGAPASADVAGGHVSAMVATVPTALPQIKAGRVKPLVVAVDERLPQLPDVPAAPEAGLQDFNVASMYALLAPAGTDQAVVDELNAAVREVTGSDSFKKAMADRGIVAVTTTTAQARDRFDREIAKWAKVITEANIQAK